MYPDAGKAMFSLLMDLLKMTGKEYIYINRVDVDKLVLIDSAKINRKGSFRFRVKAGEPDFYQIGYSPQMILSLCWLNRVKK